MPDFGKLVNKAKQMASEHPDQVVKGVEKLEELADKQTGGQYGNQVESAGHMVENFLGAHEEPGQQDHGQQDHGRPNQGQQRGQQNQGQPNQGGQNQ